MAGFHTDQRLACKSGGQGQFWSAPESLYPTQCFNALRAVDNHFWRHSSHGLCGQWPVALKLRDGIDCPRQLQQRMCCRATPRHHGRATVRQDEQRTRLTLSLRYQALYLLPLLLQLLSQRCRCGLALGHAPHGVNLAQHFSKVMAAGHQLHTHTGSAHLLDHDGRPGFAAAHNGIGLKRQQPFSRELTQIAHLGRAHRSFWVEAGGVGGDQQILSAQRIHHFRHGATQRYQALHCGGGGTCWQHAAQRTQPQRGTPLAACVRQHL